MKRKVYILLFFALAAINVAGQEVKEVKTDSLSEYEMPIGVIAGEAEMPAVAVCPDESVLEVRPINDEFRFDTLHLPRLNNMGQIPQTIGLYPMGWGGLYNWDLHEGLNVNLGASVFGAFGKHVPKGAGFSQDIAAMYAVPLSGKLSLAVGGYFSNTYWDNRSFRDGGLNAVLGYRFDEHWEAYLYGQKSIVNKRMPLLLYDMNDLGDRIGAAVKYNFSPKFSIQVSVEERHR